jgi:NAD(P)-dependent dehydrogenase (short-subunit alcohol dehydrogenase family)
VSKGTALVTGASRGIGRGIAIELARHGYDIVVGTTKLTPDDHTKGAYEVHDRIEELGQRCLPTAGNIADRACHQAMIDQALETFGRIDILVNNAGIAPPSRLDMLETTEDNFDEVMNVNIRGPFFFTQAIAKQMIKQVKEDTPYLPIIIFITSISSNTASTNRAEYCISKAGLSMAATCYAVRLAEHGINVYDLRPGIIKTDMTAGATEKYDTLIQDGLCLQDRWGDPKDIGKACAALAEGYFSYSTGSTIEIGGGFGVQRL